MGQSYANGGPSKEGFTWRMDTGIQPVPSMNAIYAIHALSTNGSAGSSAMAGTSSADNRAVLVTIVTGLTVVTDLGAPANVLSAALAVNKLGFACGQVDTDNSQIEAFEWNQPQGFIELGTGGTRYSSAMAINDSNQIVGIIGDSPAGMARLRARFQGGAMLLPRTLDTFDRAMIWTDAIGLQDLNTFVTSSVWTLSVADGINNKGEIGGPLSTRAR